MLGILAGLLFIPAAGLVLAAALCSWYALIPGVAIDALFVVRTAKEDEMLRELLAGYEGYAEQVRYRLIPGIW